METTIRLHVDEVRLVVPARTHEIVDPELDYREVIARIPVINKAIANVLM